jgi:hypothetical protein
MFIIYCIIGSLILLIPKFERELWREEFSVSVEELHGKVSRSKGLAYRLVLVTALVVFWPILLILVVVEYLKSKF